MKMRTAMTLLLMTVAGTVAAEQLNWKTIVNNADLIPGTAVVFNSFNQPSVNSDGLVVFRARSKGSAALGQPVHGIYMTSMSGNPVRSPVDSGSIVEIAARGKPVPQPNNTFYNGEPASFEEFPSMPRIDILSPLVATRGQSQPVYEYQTGVDPDTGLPVTTRVGTAGIYTNPGGVLRTGASLLGAVRDFPSGTQTFPFYAVPGAPAGTRFDQFPGAPAPTNGTVITFKGNYNDPADGMGKTGVYYRDVVADGGQMPVQLVANSDTVIPNPPGAPVVTFGSTAPPSAANGHMIFTGLDIEEAPTRGGIYRAPLQPSPPLQTLVGIGDQVPGEAPGVTFRAFGEGLSISSDARFVSFWGAWGAETFQKTLTCPEDGNAQLLAYCQEHYGGGHIVAIPLRQGIFVADASNGRVYPVAKTLVDGYTDFLYWVFSGRPPGTGGSDEPSLEPPRWRSSAFSALYGVPGAEVQTAFKASRSSVDGIYVRQGRSLARPLFTVVESQNTPGRAIDPMAPANSVVTAVGVERDGFRNGNLVIATSMLFADPVTPLGWAGIYYTKVAAIPYIPDPPEPVVSTTTLASSLNPAILGNTVTFTATVTGSNPTGTVNFTDGSTSIAGCSAVTLASGSFGGVRKATCSTGSLAVGVHSIVANYSGDANNLASASLPLSQVISGSALPPTTTTLVSSLNPSTFGASVTFTATVSGSGSSPTGTVAFMDGATAVAGCSAQPVNGAGQAACTTSSLAVGVHSIVANYSGDASNLASASLPLSQVISGSALPPTTTTLVSSLNPSTFGASVTFTATVSGSSSSSTPTGTVAFMDGATAVAGCSAQPVSRAGQAACTTSSLAVGVHSIVANYSGDASNLASASLPLSQVISGSALPPTTTTLVSSLNPSTFGASVTFTATVSGSGSSPTGTVAFMDGATAVAGCSAQPVNGVGQAACTTSSLAVGVHSIVANYSGDASNLASASLPLSQVISGSALPTTTTLVSSLNPSTFGASVTFTATVSGSGSSPTGTVAFMDGATAVAGCSAQPVNGAGQAACTTSSLAVGVHSIVANYSGDASNLASVSAALSQVVDAGTIPSSSIAVTSSVNPSRVGSAVTFTASVTGNAPTGSVHFTSDGDTITGCTAVMLVGSGDTRTAECTASSLTPGVHSIVSIYSGDANNDAATSTPYMQSVLLR